MFHTVSRYITLVRENEAVLREMDEITDREIETALELGVRLDELLEKTPLSVDTFATDDDPEADFDFSGDPMIDMGLEMLTKGVNDTFDERIEQLETLLEDRGE